MADNPSPQSFTTPLPATCIAIHIGIWGEAKKDARGRLLYQSVLQLAMAHDIQGATVWNSIEGASGNGRFRTVENEVSSNDLPVWITLMDSGEHSRLFIHAANEMLRDKGILCSGPVHWVTVQSAGGGGNSLKDRHSMPVSETVGQPGLHLQVFMREDAFVNGKPVYQAVAELMRHHGVLWTSTTRGLAGYGEGRKVRGRKWFGVRGDIPITMHVVDKREKLAALLPELEACIAQNALLIASEVTLHSETT